MQSVKKMKTEKEIGLSFSARMSDKETKKWFINYLKKNSTGETVSEQFRSFVDSLRHGDIPKITVTESAIKCERLQRALRYFCLKCRKETPELYKKCPNRDWRQTQLGVK